VSSSRVLPHAGPDVIGQDARHQGDDGQWHHHDHDLLAPVFQSPVSIQDNFPHFSSLRWVLVVKVFILYHIYII